MRLRLVTTRARNWLATPSARMPRYSRLLKLVADSWHHSLKLHGRSSIQSLLRSELNLLNRLPHQATVRLVMLLQSRHLPRPKCSREFRQSLCHPSIYSTSILLMAIRKLRFRTRSRTFSSMSPRFQKAMIPPLLRTLLIL